MVVLTSPTSGPSPPAVGTYIDNGSLQLVEVLGYGGYGIVYRAVPTFPSSQSDPSASYAVKCLPYQPPKRAASANAAATAAALTRQRHLHMKETTLHTIVSAHPNVITLHRTIVDPATQHTYIIMDYAPSGDLFTQILHNRTYLGHDELIKEVFCQLVDSVAWCHSLGVYHRDLKPENVLCWEDGRKIGVTDFGLATRDSWSKEFRTGSVYHMSPECHGPSMNTSSPTGYSPASSDIWSLGIILLNLITGRNPWKSASPTDPTFQAYLASPRTFLMSVLPISHEVNNILVGRYGGLLDIDWRNRMKSGFEDLKDRIRAVNTFYSKDVVFEGGMARCGWEVESGVGEVEATESEEEEEAHFVGQEQKATPQQEPRAPDTPVDDNAAWYAEPAQQTIVQSHWSNSRSLDEEMAFARPSQHQYTSSVESSLSWTPTPISASPSSDRFFAVNRSTTPSRRPVIRRTLLEELASHSLSDSGSDYSDRGTPEPPITPPAHTSLTQVDRRSRLLAPLDTTVGYYAHKGSAYLAPSPYGRRADSTMLISAARSYQDEEDMRTALESSGYDYFVKSPADEEAAAALIRRVSSSSEEEEDDEEEEVEEDVRKEDVCMSVVETHAEAREQPHDGMEYSYTYSEYSYAYSRDDDDADLKDNRMSVISTGAANRMSVISNGDNRMSVVVSPISQHDTARPDSPILGLTFPASTASTTTQPIPIPVPNREGQEYYGTYSDRRSDLTNTAGYSFLLFGTETTGNSSYTVPSSAPSFSFSAYPSSSVCASAGTSVIPMPSPTACGGSYSFLEPPSPPALHIRPPPSPSPFRSYSRRSRSRSRRPERTTLTERKSRVASTTRPRTLSSSFLSLSMKLGTFGKKSRDGDVASVVVGCTGLGVAPPPPTPASVTSSCYNGQPQNRVATAQQQSQAQFSTHWTLSTSVATPVPEKDVVERSKRRRSPLRGWFSPSKLFAAVLPSSST
ncbi:kinase-like domain-containing protein [Cristinia sonorae]|uniref:Kinase-like domain-containing protein n=1 Tax=Cristinia sonorae TaxID=1940300 RepID=A0A8K0UTZ3_9AGAR|nr:kinase-like domain-containing protein [Cristinia sonorae]